jgi:hypothetical protein
MRVLGRLFQALAIASSDANAVGAVRLTPSRRLEVELLSATYQESFVPGPHAALRFAVRTRPTGRRRDGRRPQHRPLVATPHNRFHSHFTDLPLEALAAVRKRRAVLRRSHFIRAARRRSRAVGPVVLANGSLGRAAVGACALALSIAVLRFDAFDLRWPRSNGYWARSGAPGGRVGLGLRPSTTVRSTSPRDPQPRDGSSGRTLWPCASPAAGAVSLGVGGPALFGWLRALPKPAVAPQARAG